MMIPIRCFSCGKPIAHLWEGFKKKVIEGENPKELLDELGLNRYCCRALFIGHQDLINIIARFKKG